MRGRPEPVAHTAARWMTAALQQLQARLDGSLEQRDEAVHECDRAREAVNEAHVEPALPSWRDTHLLRI